jgi:2'-5' RNA ligase
MLALRVRRRELHWHGMRLFVGIPLADEAARELAAVVERLQDQHRPQRDAVGLRWTTPDSWHITLQFLGNATAEQLDCLKKELGPIGSVEFPVQLGGLKLFDRVGILFADVSAAPELIDLHKLVVAATRHCGFVRSMLPSKLFHPHITLARARGDGRKAGLREMLDNVHRDLRFPPFTAREFVLYESHLAAHGARYQALLRVPLGSGPGTIPGGNR